MTDSDRFRVVLAGAGLAAIETALALRDLAAGRVAVTLVAPDRAFVHRSEAGSDPFAAPEAEHFPLARVAEALAAEWVCDHVAWVDAARRVLHTRTGAEIAYDALVLCVGALPHRRYEHALTIGDPASEVRALLGEIGGGLVSSLALICSEQMAWALPLYELALAAAATARRAGIPLETTILTWERAPLEVFGSAASRRVAGVLSAAGITVRGSVRCEVPAPEELRVIAAGDSSLGAADDRGGPRAADRIVTLPELRGPRIRGIPRSRSGFIPVDPHCRVRGVRRVYAAGDAVDFPVKHAGIASQQAEAVATAVAALAGAPVRPRMFRARLDGALLGGEAPLYLSAILAGGRSFASEVGAEPAGESPADAAAARLRPLLERR